MDLNQITVPVTDVERSIDFYEKLGLKLIVKALPDYARFECPEATLHFHCIGLTCNALRGFGFTLKCRTWTTM
jgi:catechol 2,3-dioxygenase-like lactoylglutathione lyase family enzyme